MVYRCVRGTAAPRFRVGAACARKGAKKGDAMFSLFGGKKKPEPALSAEPVPARKEEPFLENTTIQRAVLAPVICAMVSDGQVNQAEIVLLSSICTLSPVYYGMPSRQVSQLIHDSIADISERGAETVVREAASSLSPALRETAFSFVSRMVVADGVINAHEFAALDSLRNWLQVDEAKARQINEVMMIMLRPATA